MSAIVADLTTVIERCFDRWENAFDAARQEDYTAAEFARDVAEGWMDLAFMSMLPGARLSGLAIRTTTSVPLVRFIVTPAEKGVKLTQVIRVQRAGSAKDPLTTSGGGNIANTLYNVTMAVNSTRYLYVELDCPNIDLVPTPAGVYSGNVRTGGNAPVAQVVVVWPG